MKEIELFTDGACSGNPGPGGWGAILRWKGHEKAVSGGDSHTTNNRMELSAVIEGLKLLKEPCKVTLISDSKYVCDAISKGWARNWQKNGWRKSDKSPALNVDLWEELLATSRNPLRICSLGKRTCRSPGKRSLRPHGGRGIHES